MENHATLSPNQVIIGERLYEDAIDIVLANAQQELLIFDQDFSRGDFASLEKFGAFQLFLSENAASRMDTGLAGCSKEDGLKCVQNYN